MNVIIPCPFCGKQPDYLKTALPNDSWVACDNKKCGVKPSTPYCETWDRAVSIWNTRNG